MGMLDPQQLQTMKARPGFIAALDQSGGSTPGALRAYGIKDGAWSSEDERFQNRASDTHAHHDEPRLHGEDSCRDPVREHGGP
jgi:fructose-bisphosphate aldolase class 1